MSLIRRRLLDDTIKKTASGNPIAVQSVARMRPGIKIFGRSTQDGTPSPDNPVPIVNAGEDGEITVYVSGANLLDIDHINFRPSESTGLTAQLLDDGTIQVSGTPVSAYATVCSTELSLPDGTYFISGGEVADGKLYAQILIEIGDTTAYYINKSFTITGEEDRIYFSIQTGSGLSYVDDYKIKPMLNFGDTALPWGPYRGLQDIPIQTPNGLLGIPVDSGGNYTDENGQQWACDEVDFKRGVYVQRVGRNANVNDWDDRSPGNQAIEPTTSRFSLPLENIDNYKYSPCICNRLPYAKVDSYSTEGTYVTINEVTAKRIFARIEGITSLEDFKAAVPDLEVIWLLETPIEAPLSSEQIAAYKALYTYSPTTTMMNDEKAGMKLTYKTRKGLETDA